MKPNVPPDHDNDTKDDPPVFKGPQYPDDYTDIAGWIYRSIWNLANVHDPSVIKSGNHYYMYSTDASYGNVHDGHGHFLVRKSNDLVQWEFMGMVFDRTPGWVKDSLNAIRARYNPPLPSIDNPSFGHWAPHISKVGDTYRLYYSINIREYIVGDNHDNSWRERNFIGLAITNDLSSNNWEDQGMVVRSEPDGQETYYRSGPTDWRSYFKFNAIDPSFIITPEGEHWLIYGSWHMGIAAVQLNPESGKPFRWETEADFGERIAGRGNVNTNRWQALEAPEIIYNHETGYYYLFLANDELNIAYNTRVARSRNILGPYYGIDGGNVTQGAQCWPMLTHPYAFDGHSGWVGISHCSVFRDSDTGQWYFASQGRLPPGIPGINASNAVMMGHVRELEWTADGWPVVMPQRYASVPKTNIDHNALVGSYEVIVKNYQYQLMQTSESMVLRADGVATGVLNGNWSFDTESSILNIGNQSLIVKDGYDWEANPRKTTIVFSGLTECGKPIWGKRL